ncbi:MAG: hypothetical protein WCO56_05035 [Verrucomicrobiota bacterium]
MKTIIRFSTGMFALAGVLSAALAQETNEHPLGGLTPGASSAKTSQPVFDTWEITGRTFANLNELTGYAKDGGFVVVGRFGDFHAPAKVVGIRTGTNSISYRRKNGSAGKYPGFDGFELKTVTLEDPAGNETIVVLRSHEKVVPDAVTLSKPVLSNPLSPTALVLTTNDPAPDKVTKPELIVASVSPDKLPVEDAWRLVEAGRKLSAADFSAGELKLQKDPTDLATRLQLLGHEGHGHPMSPAGVKLLLGVIENNPRSRIAGPICIVISAFDQQTFTRAIGLWQDFITANPADVRILGNAAMWMEQFAMVQPEFKGKSKALYEKVRALEPNNPDWAEHMGRAWLGEATILNAPEQTDQRIAAAKQCIQQFEAAERLRHQSSRDAYRMQSGESYLEILARASLLAGETNQAKAYATQLLKTVDAKTDTWNYGNLIHGYNSFLGLIAVHEGKPDEAAKYLLAAGKTPGSPQLNSFGPDFMLAKELLRLGQKDVVLQYLDSVGNFWGNTNKNAGEKNANTIRVNLNNLHTLESYRQAIRDGKFPADPKWSR